MRTKKKLPAAKAVKTNTSKPQFVFTASATLILSNGARLPVILRVRSHEEIMLGHAEIEGNFRQVPAVAIHMGFRVEIFGRRCSTELLEWNLDERHLTVDAGPIFRAIGRAFPAHF
ncbi:MAG: hypothetical protein NTZ72_00665 [Afipia sp.]|nr:hypothetical protein [Afipia sp.]